MTPGDEARVREIIAEELEDQDTSVLKMQIGKLRSRINDLVDRVEDLEE